MAKRASTRSYSSRAAPKPVALTIPKHWITILLTLGGIATAILAISSFWSHYNLPMVATIGAVEDVTKQLAQKRIDPLDSITAKHESAVEYLVLQDLRKALVDKQNDYKNNPTSRTLPEDIDRLNRLVKQHEEKISK